MCQKLLPPFPSQNINLILIRNLRKAWNVQGVRSRFYLRMIILGRHCLGMTRCCCRGSLLHRLSLLVGLKRK